LCYSLSNGQGTPPGHFGKISDSSVHSDTGLNVHVFRYSITQGTIRLFMKEFRVGSAIYLTTGRCFEQDVTFGFKARMACTFLGDCHGPKISQ
jgi:hypothetical protein